MKSVTFTITVKVEPDDNYPCKVNIFAHNECVGDLYMTKSEWDAFKSLLIPSPKADFVLKESE
jgi:hypothetical protein